MTLMQTLRTILGIMVVISAIGFLTFTMGYRDGQEHPHSAPAPGTAPFSACSGPRRWEATLDKGFLASYDYYTQITGSKGQILVYFTPDRDKVRVTACLLEGK